MGLGELPGVGKVAHTTPASPTLPDAFLLFGYF